MAVADKNLALIRLAESTATHFRKIDFADQTEAQKVFSSIWELESKVNNGGFDAYFRYANSEVIAFAPIALTAIGASRCSEIVERALQILGSLPATREGREDLLDALDADDELDELDQEFFAYPDDVTDLLFAFVEKRPETFGPVS